MRMWKTASPSGSHGGCFYRGERSLKKRKTPVCERLNYVEDVCRLARLDSWGGAQRKSKQGRRALKRFTPTLGTRAPQVAASVDWKCESSREGCRSIRKPSAR